MKRLTLFYSDVVEIVLDFGSKIDMIAQRKYNARSFELYEHEFFMSMYYIKSFDLSEHYF